MVNTAGNNKSVYDKIITESQKLNTSCIRFKNTNLNQQYSEDVG